MTDSPTDSTGTSSEATQAAAALLGGPSSARPYTDPVEEQGARFAQQADEDEGRPAPDDGDPGDLSPDFLAPVQPS